MIDKFLDHMKYRGWTAEVNEEQKFCLPEPMKSRYTGYPKSRMEFASTVKSMIRGDEEFWDGHLPVFFPWKTAILIMQSPEKIFWSGYNRITVNLSGITIR